MPDIFDASQINSPNALQESEVSDASEANFDQSEPDTDAVTQDSSFQAQTSQPLQTASTPPISNFEQRKQTAVAHLMEDMEVSSNPFGSFATQPSNTCVDIQMTNEEILLLMRQHPVTQLKWILTAIILIFLPFLFSYVPLLAFLPTRFQSVAVIGWYLMTLGFVLEAFLDWFYNIYIVTNQRVIDVDFSSLLFKNISTAKLERIEDVNVTNKGYLGSVFDFGTVVIQTAGAIDEFEFEETPHPNRVSAFINDLLAVEEEVEREEK